MEHSAARPTLDRAAAPPAPALVEVVGLTKRFGALVANDRIDLALFGQLHSLRTELTPWQHQVVDDHAPLRSYLDRVDEATRSGAPQPRVSDAAMAVA